MKNLLFTVCLFLSIIAKAEVRFVRVMFYGDASQNATIGWDQFKGEAHVLFYDTSDLSVNNYNKCIDQFIVKHDKAMNNHFVELTGLQPNTRYNFIIRDSEGDSKRFYFYTVPNNPEIPLSFIAGGDSRTRSAVRRKANLMVAKLKPHAVLFDGDYTAVDTPKEWLQWFTDWELTTGKDGRISPIVPSRGNHERSNKVMVNIFNVPHKKVFYSTQFGGSLVNLVVLNSEIWKGGRQTWFLRGNLRKHQSYKWSIPMYHRPMRPHVKHKKEMKTQYKNFLPVFEQFPNVRLSIECDSHTCKTTWPIKKCKDEEGCDEGFIRDDEEGIVYIGEGCGGAPPREADDLKSWTRDAEKNDSFKLLFVSQEKIEVRTVLYSNSTDVKEVSADNRFELPENLKLWTPPNGDVVVVSPKK